MLVKAVKAASAVKKVAGRRHARTHWQGLLHMGNQRVSCTAVPLSPHQTTDSAFERVLRRPSPITGARHSLAQPPVGVTLLRMRSTP